jgi:triosephosphate isomerase
MNLPRFYLGSGWKMNKTVSEAVDYLERLRALLPTIEGREEVQLFVLPPFTALEAAKRHSGGILWVGAQNMHWAERGAYTGEVSAAMLEELGVDLVELGHAERRLYFNETDADINRKVLAALAHGLRPLLCVGETLEEREAHAEHESVARQLKLALRGVPPHQAGRLLIADEPHWAIGEAGRAADPAYIQSKTNRIRQVLVSLFGPEPGAAIPILYGGDVNLHNAAEIVAQTNTDGLFIGRASLEASNFAELLRLSIQALASRAAGPVGVGRRGSRPDRHAI